MLATDPLSTHFRLAKPQLSALRKLGIRSIGELLRHFPVRYEAAGAEGSTRTLVYGEKVTLYGTLSKLEAKKLWKSRRTATTGYFEDEGGRVKVLWFNQPYIAKMAPQGVPIRLTGTVAGKDTPYITNPEIEALPPGFVRPNLFSPSDNSHVNTNDLFPVYPESHGITSRWFYHALERVFASGAHTQEDPLPEDIRTRLHLPDIATALHWIHRPEKQVHAEAARKRFAFEEMFVLSVARAKDRHENSARSGYQVAAADLSNQFLASIPFPPTSAQRRAIGEIVHDLQKPHPMSRLLEGDVGSGKTLVAAACAYAVVHARPLNQSYGTLQVAYMAPTEILAKQHFESFVEYFRELPISIALITGSECKKYPSKTARGGATTISRAQLLKWVAQGEIAMIVGTHALIQKALTFKHVALVIVDEQHRFGTKQRQALVRKSEMTPHFLSMTATPIPRTLALTLYGDLDLSVLDELPKGRLPVTTTIVRANERERAYTLIREKLREGRQAYVICPRIEEPDPEKLNALQAKSAKAEAKRLQKDVFPEYHIGLLHGAQTAKEKEKVMAEFTQHKIDILVATSVVEVGVNVPNATVILIEGAERFGLSQLHQLRGRVQRSHHPPHCFLLPETRGDTAMKRLKTMEKSSDGFALAEADLEARGAGDLRGTRQWGISDLGMDALKNAKLISIAREEATSLVAADPSLRNHAALRTRVDAPLPHQE